MSNTKKYLSFRCKVNCGLSVKWTIGLRNEKWSIIALGDAKSGRSRVQTASIPDIDFDLSRAVYEGRLFDTPEAAEAHARSL